MTSLQPDKPAYQGSTVRTTPPLELAIVTLPALGGHPDRETARGGLARAALKDSLEAWSGPLSFGQAITGLRKDLEGSAILVAAPRPVELVAQALEDGLDLGTALEAWRSLSRDLTAFLERRRNTILLAWDAAVLRDPATVAEEVAARLGLDVETPAPPVATQEAPPAPGARHLLRAELGLARLATDPEAPAPLDRYWLALPDHADGPLRHRLETDMLLQRITEEARAAGQNEIRTILRDAEEAWLERETRRIETHAAELAEERASQKAETDRHLAEILRLSQEAEYYRGLSEKLQSAETLAPDRAGLDTLERTLKEREDALRKALADKDRMEKLARANIDQLAARLETAQGNLKTLRAEKAGLEKTARAEIDRLTSELGTLRAQTARDRERSREHDAEARRLREMVETSNVRRRSAEERAALQKQDLDGLRTELETMRADIAAARAEAEAMRHSTSWRVTRPLRGVGSLLRRRSDPPPPKNPGLDQAG